MYRYRIAVTAAVILLLAAPFAAATDFKPIVPDPSYDHDRWGTEPKDLVYTFRAYVTSFDSDDDDDGDGKPDYRGIPEWVAYEMKAYPRKLRAGPKRPSPWITDRDLFEAGIAPSDATYQYSSSFRKRHANWYDRGHLCMRDHAWRQGAAADWNTHTVLNAVPQRHSFNSGIWLDLENLTAAWADKYGAIWVIDGPIFYHNREPTAFLGEKGEMKIAIPDALFKIVIKLPRKASRPDVLAFVYDQECDECKSARGPFHHLKYATSVKDIEDQTGLRFFTKLPKADREAVETAVATELWPSTDTQ